MKNNFVEIYLSAWWLFGIYPDTLLLISTHHLNNTVLMYSNFGQGLRKSEWERKRLRETEIEGQRDRVRKRQREAERGKEREGGRGEGEKRKREERKEREERETKYT